MDFIGLLRDKSRRSNVVGSNDVKKLLEMYDTLLKNNVELQGEIAMWKANADEAALTTARLQERVAQLEADFSGLVAGHNGMLVDAEKVGHEFICKILLDDMLVGESGGNWPNRMQIELRNLRAQLAEAHALGYPVNLFENQANVMKSQAQ